MPTPAPPDAEPLPPEHELSFRTSRSSGPGGQHVNKTETRVEVIWPLADSTAVSDAQRTRLQAQLATRLDGDGRLVVACSSSRSQARNRSDGIARMRELVAQALVIPRPRKKKRLPRAVKEKRLQAKRRQAERKADRRRPDY